jgi:hypothetical protein
MVRLFAAMSPQARLVMSYFVNGFETAEELTPDASALFVQHSAHTT